MEGNTHIVAVFHAACSEILRVFCTEGIYGTCLLYTSQKPKAAREDSPPDAAKEHFCYGCKRFGQSCVRP